MTKTVLASPHRILGEAEQCSLSGREHTVQVPTHTGSTVPVPPASSVTFVHVINVPEVNFFVKCDYQHDITGIYRYNT